MNLLLDTHVLIWTQQDSPRLGKRIRKALLDPSNALWISAVSALEISRLVRGERLHLGRPVDAWWRIAIASLGSSSQPIDHAIAIESYQLPEPFHSDPADRLLVATARLQGYRLVTADERLLSYRHAQTMDARK